MFLGQKSKFKNFGGPHGDPMGTPRGPQVPKFSVYTALTLYGEVDLIIFHPENLAIIEIFKILDPNSTKS